MRPKSDLTASSLIKRILQQVCLSEEVNEAMLLQRGGGDRLSTIRSVVYVVCIEMGVSARQLANYFGREVPSVRLQINRGKAIINRYKNDRELYERIKKNMEPHQ